MAVREPRAHHRALVPACVALALTGVLLGGGAWAARGRALPPESELAVARRTYEQVLASLEARSQGVAARVRALYRLERAGAGPLWLAADGRGDLVRRRAAGRRMILRDLAEHQALREETARLGARVGRLAWEVASARVDQAPEPGTLRRPVPGPIRANFGVWRHPGTRARLLRRGVEFGSRAGEAVVAPRGGTVVHAGSVRGLGECVLLEHAPGLWTLVSGLSGELPSVGTHVDTGAAIGVAKGSRVYLELRRSGRPVNPAPYLSP